MPDVRKSDDNSLPALVSELWDLIVRYAKQETVEPLKALWRFLRWGLLGTVCLCMGVVLLSLAALRAVQLEAAPHLTRDLSWVPYVGVLVVVIIFAMVLARAIGADRRRVERERAKLNATTHETRR